MFPRPGDISPRRGCSSYATCGDGFSATAIGSSCLAGDIMSRPVTSAPGFALVQLPSKVIASGWSSIAWSSTIFPDIPERKSVSGRLSKSTMLGTSAGDPVPAQSGSAAGPSSPAADAFAASEAVLVSTLALMSENAPKRRLFNNISRREKLNSAGLRDS